MIAEYQNIVVKELMPLLLGEMKAKLLQSVPYDKDVQVEITAEGLVLGYGLAEMFSYQEELDISEITGERLKENFVSRSETGLRVGFEDRVGLEKLVILSKRLGVEDWKELQNKCPGWSFSDSQDFSNPLVAAIQEKPLNEGILGSTFSCFFFQLVAKLISGDNFWFLNKFSSNQVREIQFTTLSSLICRNLDKVSVQKKVLLLPDTSLNSPVPCPNTSDLDLNILLSSDDLEMSDEELAMIEEAVAEAQAQLNRRHIEEVDLYQKKKVAPSKSGRGSPSFGKPSQAAQAVASSSAVLEVATYKINEMTDRRSKRSQKSIIKSYARKIIGSNSASNKAIEKIKSKVLKSIQSPVNGPKSKTVYQPSPMEDNIHKSEPTSCSSPEDNAPCDHTSKYRTYSGRCNNLESPDFGKSTTLLRRLLSPEYNDGISFPRSKSVDGRPLPNPRKVSQRIHTTQVTPDPKFSLSMMQWGQFIDHDMVLTPIHRGFNSSILDCKPCNSSFDHPACFPILIPKDDIFYPKQSDRQCMAFTRSLPGQQKLGPREQMNQITHYLDGSMIYGSDSCHAKDLRVPDSYLLRMTNNPASHPARPMKDLLPMTGNNHECRSGDGQCFLAGDERVNEQPGLTSFHTLMLREHNDVSKELASINPHWTNEKIFQETRRIISAIIQHITYNEFLPRVLGLRDHTDAMNRYFSAVPE